MQLKAAFFCHNGLGDGVNCLVLSNNLYINGFSVDTFQNTIGSMQNWFPHLPVFSYPEISKIDEILHAYDLICVVQNDSSDFVKKLILEGKQKNPEKIKVLYLYPSPNIIHEKYYQDCLTDHKASIAANMRIVAEKVLGLPKITSSNGFTAPSNLVLRKNMQTVAIHPTSARATRNWDKTKFIQLGKFLKQKGFDVVFIPGKEEISNWQDVKSLGFSVLDFSTLDELAQFLYQSGFFIGNDSGLGHLASALGIPTVTICRRVAWAKMWAPSFQTGVVVTPSSWIPNISGFRLRDKHWKKFISVSKVLKRFEQLVLYPG